MSSSILLSPKSPQADINGLGEETLTKSIGKASIGGPFSLNTTIDTEFTERDLLGKWSLIYFGFTNCPDICPEELDKMGQAVDLIQQHNKDAKNGDVQPIFISVDPARDSVEQVRKYIKGESSSL